MSIYFFSLSFLLGIFLGDLIFFSKIIFPSFLIIFLALILIAIFWRKEKTVFLFSLSVFSLFLGLLYFHYFKDGLHLPLTFLAKPLFYLKSRFETTLEAVLPEPFSSLEMGLILGTKAKLPKDLLFAFSVVGITHIIALSGYNISIIADNLGKFFRLIWPKLSFWLSLIFIWLFVIMTGAMPSVVRAAIMGCLALLAYKVGRRRETGRILILTALFMVCQNPTILKKDVGFQLSFLATIGLIYFSSLLKNFLNRFSFFRTSFWPDSVKEAFLATISAQIFVLPLLLFYFKKLSLIAPLCNVLILPIIPYTMLLGFLAGIFGLIWQGFGEVFAFLAYPFLKYIVFLSETFSKIPGAYFNISKFHFSFIVIYYFILIFLIWLWRKRFKEG